MAKPTSRPGQASAPLVRLTTGTAQQAEPGRRAAEESLPPTEAALRPAEAGAKDAAEPMPGGATANGDEARTAAEMATATVQSELLSSAPGGQNFVAPVESGLVDAIETQAGCDPSETPSTDEESQLRGSLTGTETGPSSPEALTGAAPAPAVVPTDPSFASAQVPTDAACSPAGPLQPCEPPAESRQQGSGVIGSETTPTPADAPARPRDVRLAGRPAGVPAVPSGSGNAATGSVAGTEASGPALESGTVGQEPDAVGEPEGEEPLGSAAGRFMPASNQGACSEEGGKAGAAKPTAAAPSFGANRAIPVRHEAIRYRRLDGETRQAVHAALSRALGGAPGPQDAVRTAQTASPLGFGERPEAGSVALHDWRLVPAAPGGDDGTGGRADGDSTAGFGAEPDPRTAQRLTSDRTSMPAAGGWFDGATTSSGHATAPGSDVALSSPAPPVGLTTAQAGQTTAGSSQVSSPASAPGAPMPVPSQVVRAISLAWKAGQGEARIRLQPEHLGELVVTLRVEQGVVVAIVKAENAEARERIQANEALLREGLAQQGLDLDSLVVTADPDRRREQPQTSQRRPARAYRRAPDSTTPFSVEVDA